MLRWQDKYLIRLVGYKISPVLWEKLSNNRLSAGRVQSVAVRLICEREEEIEVFVPKEYWTISAELAKAKSANSFIAELTKHNGKKIEINNEDEAKKILNALNAENQNLLSQKSQPEKQNEILRRLL